MSDSIRRRRLILAVSVLMLLVAPWALTPWPQATAQVDTTTTTDPEPTTTTIATTTTTRAPTPTTVRRTTTTRQTTTTTTSTTTTTLPPTTTTTSTTTTTTVPAETTTTTTTTVPGPEIDREFVPPPANDPADPGGGGLPGWAWPFLGAGAMLGAILLATGAIRFFTRGVPAIGRGLGSVAYKTSNAWALLREREENPASFNAPRPGFGARVGGFFLALTRPFRRLGRGITGEASAARRLRDSRQQAHGSLWDRILLRLRMVRARFTRTRSSVEGQRRYWWLRFRRFIPWLR